MVASKTGSSEKSFKTKFVRKHRLSRLHLRVEILLNLTGNIILITEQHRGGACGQHQETVGVDVVLVQAKVERSSTRTSKLNYNLLCLSNQH